MIGKAFRIGRGIQDKKQISWEKGGEGQKGQIMSFQG